jgi:competence protein ComEC
MTGEPASTAQSLDSRAPIGLSAVPLFHAAWLFALGIFVARGLWLRPAVTLVALAAVAALCAIAAMRALRIAWLPLGLLWLLLGLWCAEMEPHPAPAPKLAALSDGLLRTVQGTVIDAAPVRTEIEQNIDEPSGVAPAQRIDLRVSSLEQVTDAEDVQLPVSGTVRLIIRWPQAAPGQGTVPWFQCGDRLQAVVRLLPPASYHDPGAFSREEYLLDQGITATAAVNADHVERTGVDRLAPASQLACRMQQWQHAFTVRLLALPGKMAGFPAPLRLREEDAIMLAAMIAGDRTYLTHSLRAGFERTGSFHMLVVSGFHLAVVAGCFFWIAGRLRLLRLPMTLLTIAATFAYALLTGFATPVQRSLWMVILYLLGRLIYRERSPLNVVGFAALVLLAVSPRSLFDASFQMTLLAVIAVAGLALPLLNATIHPYARAARDLRLVAIDIKLPPELAEFRVMLRMVAVRLARAINGFVAWRVFPWAVRAFIRAIDLIVVACIVELVMTLPMAVYFHRITLYALPVNLLILPLLAILMPVALLTVLALAAWPAAAVFPAAATALVLHFSLRLVRIFGSMAMADYRIASPLHWQLAASCLLLAAAIAMAHFGVLFAWLRRAAWAALVAAGVVAVLPRPIDRPRSALLVEAIDVGQGDSILLIAPDGKTLLVDAGGFGGGPRQAPQDFDIGEEVVSAVLWSRGIRHLDAVALSHAHSDHMGGMPAVLRNFHPAELWVGSNPHFPAYDSLLAEAAALHARLLSFRAGERFLFGPAQVEVLAPFADYRPGVEPSNNDSLVLRVVYEKTSVLLEGDAEEPIEKAMLAEPDLASTLLKVGHHGSITSTRPEFLERVAPQWAVISCGLHNRYGHPRGEVLDELQTARVRTFRTDLNGASCFVLDGRSVTPDECSGR